MATMKDIARETGLGLATISKYVNGGHVRECNRTAIEQAIANLGYTVNDFARGLKTNRSKTIGIIIPWLGNLFISSIISTVEDILRASGYSTIICDCQADPAKEKEVVHFIMGKRVDGIINMPLSTDGEHLVPAVEQGLPVVLIDRMIHELSGMVNAVLVDNVSASQQAVSILIEAGHSNIGIIVGPHGVFTTSQRLLGYSQAMINNTLIPYDKYIAYGDYTVQGGYDKMRLLLRNKDMTAVFVTNYEMTLGAVIAINELGIQIPEQLSFIGFDNQELSQVVRPRLTIVTQPLEEIGKNAAGILLRALESGSQPAPEVITLSTGMQQGNSVRKL